MKHFPFDQRTLFPSQLMQEVFLRMMGLKHDVSQKYHQVHRLTLFHPDVIYVHHHDILYSLPLCMYLFGTPCLNRLWTCR